MKHGIVYLEYRVKFIVQFYTNYCNFVSNTTSSATVITLLVRMEALVRIWAVHLFVGVLQIGKVIQKQYCIY